MPSSKRIWVWSLKLWGASVAPRYRCRDGFEVLLAVRCLELTMLVAWPFTVAGLVFAVERADESFLIEPEPLETSGILENTDDRPEGPDLADPFLPDMAVGRGYEKRCLPALSLRGAAKTRWKLWGCTHSSGGHCGASNLAGSVCTNRGL